MKTILCVVGARPNFMKIAPIMAAFSQSATCRAILVHTGQHYDAAMKATFFEQLAIPEPDYDLGVGSGAHGQQTAEIMLAIEPLMEELQPDAVLVVGDVNSTIAAALVASKKHIPVVHVEAGLRSGDRSMPEEINRILTDQLSARLYTTEQNALQNLQHEGIPAERVCFAGNVMIDTLVKNLSSAKTIDETLQANQAQVLHQPYALLTLHRPSNVDDKGVLTALCATLQKISQQIPIVFPVHPRTQKQLSEFGLYDELLSNNFICLPPLDYLSMLGALRDCEFILTDSGGLQEESSALGIPCVTLRENTERPITLTQGTNTIVGLDEEKTLTTVADILNEGGKKGSVPELWDGQAAQRIVNDLQNWLHAS